MRRMFLIATMFCTALVLTGLRTNLTTFFGAMFSNASAQSQKPRDPDRGRKPDDDDERQEEYLKRRTFGGKRIEPDAYQRAQEQWQRLPHAVPPDESVVRLAPSARLSATTTGLTGTTWKPVGPMPLQLGTDLVNGRVHAIAIHPTNPNVIYQGVNIGGVWKTVDGGANWTALFDEQPALGIGQPGAIAIDPNNPNTVYVGTNSRFQQSQGILKSTDGGASWIVIGSGYPAGNTGNAQATFQGRSVDSIIIEPNNSNIVYLVASNGLFRSIDGGQNWTQGTNGAANGGDRPSNSLALDTSSPANARVLFAGIGGSGIRRSNDGGQTWTTVFNSATAVTSASMAVATAVASGNFGKIVVALAPPRNPANPAGVQVIYATMEGTGTGTPDPLGIFMSTDQGATWQQQAAAGLGSCQCNSTMQMSVDPASPGNGTNDILYWGGTNQVKSTDSGANFSDISNGQHVDTRAEWVFIRQPSPAPSTVYTGNDGGIYRSVDGGATWTGTGPAAPPTINAGGLQTALIYRMDIKRDASASVSAASFQDNGSGRSTPSAMFPLLWTVSTGGDGFDIVFDRINVNDAFEIHNVSGTTDGVFKSTDSAASFPTSISAGIPASELGIFSNGLDIDPNNAGFVYVSGSATSLFQNKNAASFTNIQNFGSGVGAVDVAPGNANNVAVVVGGNQVFVSTNALGMSVSFTNITRNLPTRSIQQVAFDPNDTTVIYATVSGFNSQSPTRPGHVFRTTISGTTWQNISPALDVPYDAIALDGSASPTGIYVGTDLGVMRSVDGGTSWAVLDDAHFPNLPVTDLKINAQAGVLRASTFGRGTFELAAPTGPVIAVNAENGLNFANVCQGEGAATLNLQLFNIGTENLRIDSVQRIFGSTDFTVLSSPATPFTILPGSSVTFVVQFNPAAAGMQTATIRVASNDPGSPFYDLTATGTTGAATIATVIADTGNFGDVCVGQFKDLSLTINNPGQCDLRLTGITSSSTEFQTAGVLSFPLVIAPGSSLQVPIRFRPTSFGMKNATLKFNNNDPASPMGMQTVAVSGNAPTATIVVNDPIIFDNTCPGNVNNKTLTIGNSGGCDLIVKSITSDSPEFKVVGVVPFPLVIPPGSTRDVTIQFMPMGFNINPVHMATLTIMSNDLNTPNKTVTVKGIVPPPIIQVMPDPLDFGKVCLGKSKDLPLTIKNTGDCNLTVSNITSNSPEFTLPNLPALPIVIPPGGMRDVIVRFTPASTGMKSGKITITSDDPATPVKMVTVMGTAPVSAIAVTGSFDWGDVLVGQYKEHVINITNTEECDLAITLVCEVKNGVPQQPSTEFNVVNVLNYPVIIPAGKTLPVFIRFRPAKKGPREATLIVFGYDPQTSNLVLTASYPLKGNGK